MKKLDNDEMVLVRGGGVSSNLLWGLIGGAVIFFMGLIDGIVNPKKCN